MMSLCHKTISSNNTTMAMDTKTINFPFFHPHHHHHQNSVFFKLDHQHNPTVENSSSSSFPIILPAAMDNNNSSIESLFKMDPPGVGFLDDVGGTTVDGLMSCTESLGFESSDERRVDDLIENLDEMEVYSKSKSKSISKSKLVGKSKIKMFPPPLSSMSQDGKPVSYLQPMRIDGRLKLTEVRISRAPEVLRASREDGRLRLHLIQDLDDYEDEIKNEEMDNHNGVKMQVQGSDDVAGDGDEWLEERAESNILSDDHLKMKSDDERAESQLLSLGGDDDGLVTRCYDGRGKPSSIPSRHHHLHGPHLKHDIHVWRQQLMC